MFEDDEDKNFCYIEGSLADKNTAEEVSELHENVWYKLKPPKWSSSTYTPFVTARQIDLARAILLGKNMLKTNEVKIEFPIPKPPPRSDPPREPTLEQKKSSVKFLSTIIYK